MKDAAQADYDERDSHLKIIEEFVRMGDQEIRELQLRADIASRIREIRSLARELEGIEYIKNFPVNIWSDRPAFHTNWQDVTAPKTDAKP
jgi:hypothetical protein